MPQSKCLIDDDEFMSAIIIQSIQQSLIGQVPIPMSHPSKFQVSSEWKLAQIYNHLIPITCSTHNFYFYHSPTPKLPHLIHSIHQHSACRITNFFSAKITVAAEGTFPLWGTTHNT
jgi:hypothetical protein